MAAEGGEGPASEGESAGGAQEEAGGAAAEGGETSSAAGGETETETRKEQGEKVKLPIYLSLKLTSESSKNRLCNKHCIFEPFHVIS